MTLILFVIILLKFIFVVNYNFNLINSMINFEKKKKNSYLLLKKYLCFTNS